ncbi:MAG TPA: hypothetical protein PLC39_06985, partial [Methanomassiliicoccales archaeon]|nr:hypothetical protein [Methanomassiliicoccales archaeon]
IVQHRHGEGGDDDNGHDGDSDDGDLLIHLKFTLAIKIEIWYKAFLSIKVKFILFVQILSHIAHLYPVKSTVLENMSTNISDNIF